MDIRRAADHELIMKIIEDAMTRVKTDKAQAFMTNWKIIAGEMPEPEEEYNFDACWGRKHRFDFAFPNHLVAVEIEGNAWNVKGGGKHMQERDLEKYNIAAALGWRILRFSPSMLSKDPYGCVQIVQEAIEWNSTKKFSDIAGDTSVNVDAVKKDTTHITPLSTTSNAKVKRNTRNSMTRETSSL